MAWISYRLHCVSIAGRHLIVEVLIESLWDVKDRGTRWTCHLHLHLHPSHAWMLDSSCLDAAWMLDSNSCCWRSVQPDKLLQLWGGSHPTTCLLLLNNLHLALLLLSLLNKLCLLLLRQLHLLLRVVALLNVSEDGTLS